MIFLTHGLDGSFSLGGLLQLGDHVVKTIECVSGIWLLCLGGLFVLGRHWLKTYIASEILLAAPTLLLLASYLSSYNVHTVLYQFSRAIYIFVAFSVVPLCLAIYCLRKRRIHPADGSED